MPAAEARQVEPQLRAVRTPTISTKSEGIALVEAGAPANWVTDSSSGEPSLPDTLSTAIDDGWLLLARDNDSRVVYRPCRPRTRSGTATEDSDGRTILGLVRCAERQLGLSDPPFSRRRRAASCPSTPGLCGTLPRGAAPLVLPLPVRGRSLCVRPWRVTHKRSSTCLSVGRVSATPQQPVPGVLVGGSCC